MTPPPTTTTSTAPSPAALNVGRLFPLYAAQALATGATNVSTILSSVIMSGLGRENLSGLPATFISLSAALTAGLFGSFMLRRGRRMGLGAAFTLGAAGALLGFTGARLGNPALFLAGAALMGGAQGGYQQARYAAAESVPPGRRGSALGLLMLMSVAGSLAMTLTSRQIEGLGTRLGSTPEVAGWLVAAALMLLSAALMLAWKPVVPTPAPATPTAPVSPSATAPARLNLRAAFATPGVKGTALALATAQGVMVTLMSLTPLRAHHAGMDHAGVAGLITGHVLGMFGFGWLTGPLIDRLGLRSGYVTGAALLLAAALTAPLHGTPWLATSMFLLGLGWNFVNLSGSKAMTRYPAAQGVTDGLGYAASAAGTFLGGLVIAHQGFPALAYACAALSLLPLLSAWRHRN